MADKDPPTEKQRIQDYYDYIKNQHLHKIRKLSQGTRALTVQQLDAIKKVLDTQKRTHATETERELEKRRKRRQLGLPHRKLKRGWMFLEPIKKLLPRRVRVNNFIPDYIFYFCNSLLLISAGINYGTSSAVRDLDSVLGQIGITSPDPTRTDTVTFALTIYGNVHSFLGIYLLITTILGFNFFYGAIKEGHWAYFLLMVGGLALEGGLGLILIGKDSCSELVSRAEDRFSSFVTNYYFSVPAIDEEGRKLFNPDGSEFIIRTYHDANIMDTYQKYGQCCGSSGFRDYFARPDPTPALWTAEVPQSCCAPLWNRNIYCAKEIPVDEEELKLKINQVGCTNRTRNVCENAQYMFAEGAINLTVARSVLFLICCMMMIYQLRQIRQLERPTHFHIPAETINIALPVSEELKTKRLIDVLSLDPDQIELSDELIEAINLIRRDLGLADLGKQLIELLQEPPVVVIERPQVVNLPKSPPPVNPYKIPIHNIAKELIRTRLDIFELNSLKPYYKGLFSATYQQENKAATNDLMKELKGLTSTYHAKEDWDEIRSARSQKAAALKKEMKEKEAGSKTSTRSKVPGHASRTKNATKVVTRKSKVKANPGGGSQVKTFERNKL